MMGASVVAYWPGITEAQIRVQPFFRNDSRAWGDWMAEREQEPDVRQVIADLGVGAILTYKTDGMDDSEVRWVTPRELQDAARRLRDAVEGGQWEIFRVIEVYARHTSGVGSASDEFVRDLEDVEALARWAEGQGAPRMTLEVGW